MSTPGEHPSFTRPNGTIADTEALWRNATETAIRLGNTAAQASFEVLATRASLDHREKDDYQNESFDEMTTRISRAVNAVNSEVVQPRKTGLAKLGYTTQLRFFNESVDGTSLIESHHQPIVHTEPRGVPVITRIYTGEGLSIKPDTHWQAIFDSVVILMTHGNPEWQDEPLPDLINANEKATIVKRIDTEMKKYKPPINGDEHRQIIIDQDLLTNLYHYDRRRKLFTTRRTPTEFGVDLVHLAETTPKYPPHVQQFLIAQKQNPA